jgi:hypothetical protein
MVRCMLRCRKWLRLAIAAGIAVWTLAGTAALAQTPACNGKNVYPCSVGGTLLVLGKPTGLTLNGGSLFISGGGGSGTFINDPQNPGFALTAAVPLVSGGPQLPSTAGTFSLATVSGQATITGANLSIACGVTGAAAYSMTLSTPGGPLVLNCPNVAAQGTTVTVTSQIAFSALSSLAMTLTLSGTATTASDTLTVGGFSAQVQIPSPGCTSTVSPGGQAFAPAGGSGNINITTSPGCPWGVFNTPSWVTVTSAASGTGNGTASYQVAANAGPDRSATITVTNASFNVEQEAASIAGLNFIGSMPDIAAEENWTTAFTLVNKDAASAQARLSLFGDPGGPLTIPLAFPQQPPAAGPLLAASLDRTLAANASLIVNSAGPQTPPVLVGSAQLAATGSVDGFAIFHLIPGAQEAVVPMETRNAPSYLLAFDNTGGVVLGVAVENVSALATNIPVVIRDDTGALIGPPGATISLAGNGHTSFVLSDPVQGFPVTANKRGTIEFDTPAGGQISVLGIRTTLMGSSNTLTTIPALANVGTNGGSIAHIATGNGWQTSFVLVNTGASAAQAHLKFFADTGSPLSLPLSFPQSGGTSTASSVDQALNAGATLVVQSVAPPSDPAPTIGSAQLTTSGNIGGFVIFRYNPNGQEAVVPLESRNANAYILAFDNTAGTGTGVAINSVSTQAVNIPVVVRNDAGTQIATDTITLAANGHLAFTLVTDKYAATANKRGTIEFDTPAGAQIGALGIRIPVAHTFTTLPALVK